MADLQLYALFQDVADAERGIGALLDHGIRRENIGVIARRPAEEDEAAHLRSNFTRVIGHEDARQGEPVVMYEAHPAALPPAAIAETVTPVGTVDTVDNVDTVGKEGITTTTPQDAAAGAAVGTGIGLVTGILAAAAAITLPGVGVVLAGGALASAFAAAIATTAAGALAGGAAGYLRDMGMPEQAAASYADRLHEGNYLVAVTVDTGQYDDVKRLLMKYNAAGVDMNLNQEDLRQGAVWGSDPVLIEQLRRGPAADAPVPLSSSTASTLTESSAAAPNETPVKRTPIIMTEKPDGTPIVPAETVTRGDYLSGESLDDDEAAEIVTAHGARRDGFDAVS